MSSRPTPPTATRAPSPSSRPTPTQSPRPAGTGTSLGDYDTTVECTGEGAASAGTSLQVTVSAGENVECTITNNRKPEIRVLKDVVPDSDPGRFDLKIDSAVYDNGGAGFGDTATGTGFRKVTTGSHTVSEVGHGTTSLSNYASKVECDSARAPTPPARRTASRSPMATR